MKKEKPSFRISELIQRIINFSLLQTFLDHAKIESILSIKIQEHGKGHKKSTKKEEVDFYLIRINRSNFDIRLDHLFREINKGDLKLAPADDAELVLFHPEFWRYFIDEELDLYHTRFWRHFYRILFGIRIIVLESPGAVRHGTPVYLSGDSGIFTNRVGYVPENLIFSSKRSLYVLAKAVKIKHTDHSVFLSEVIERQVAIKTCQAKLTELEGDLEILEVSNSEEFRSKIIAELKSVEKITISLEYHELKKRVEGIKNRLCCHIAS